MGTGQVVGVIGNFQYDFEESMHCRSKYFSRGVSCSLNYQIEQSYTHLKNYLSKILCCEGERFALLWAVLTDK